MIRSWRASVALNVALALLIVVPSVWAAGAARRARPPKWDKRDADVFFSDAREKLAGERPSGGAAGSGTVAATGGSGGDDAGGGGGEAAAGSYAWSKLISSDTLEAEIKALQAEVSQTVQAAPQFKGGGYKDSRREFTELAALFAIIAEYDGEVRWKKDSAGIRDLMARAGFNCKVGTDASYNEAKLRKDDLEKLVRGEPPQVSKGDAKAKWDKVAGRPPLMQRLEKAQQQGVSPWTSDAGEFKKSADKLTREAELIAAISEAIQQEGFEFFDDDTYAGYAKQMRDGAREVVEAVKLKNYDQARKASGQIEKACSSCHEGYRS